MTPLPHGYWSTPDSSRPYRQAAFNYVWTCMELQGKPSYSQEHHLPRYRGDGGTSCTVGCLIAEGAYTEALEGLDVVELMKKGKIPPLVLPVDEGFLAGLQLAHDLTERECRRDTGLEWPTAFREAMEDLARWFGLATL